MVFMVLFMINTHLFCMDPIPSSFLAKQVVDSHIMPQISLQEMSRFKRTCNWYNECIDTEKFCPLSGCLLPCDHKCASYACSILHACHYDIRTKVLAHYAETKNLILFKHIWGQEGTLRDDDIKGLILVKEKELIFPNQSNIMNYYRRYYSDHNKIEQVRYAHVCHLVSARWKMYGGLSLYLLKETAAGSRFNIIDAVARRCKHPLKKKSHTLRKIFKSICSWQDTNLLLALLDGIIEPRALKHVFYSSQKTFIDALREKNAFIEGVPDKDGRTVDYYVFWHIIYCVPCA